MTNAREWANTNNVKLNPAILGNKDTYYGVIEQFLEQLLNENPSLTVDQLKFLPDTLKEEEFAQWAKDMLAQPGKENNTFTFYIDQGGNFPFAGDVNISDDTRRSAKSATLAPGEFASFIRDSLQEYSSLLGGKLSFKEVYSDQESLISFYRYTPVANENGSIDLGLSDGAQNIAGQKWRNVFYNSAADLGYNTIKHEIGHTLGLAHPTDLATLKFEPRIKEDGANTAYTIYDSIMSYNRKGLRGLAAANLTDFDRLAYQDTWSKWGSGLALKDLTSSLKLDKGVPLLPTPSNQRASSIFTASSTGSRNNDLFQDDPLTSAAYSGGDGSDVINYRGGFDVAAGGEGRDVFKISPTTDEGYLRILDFEKDVDRLELPLNIDVDVFMIGGATFVVGENKDILAMIQGEFTENELLSPNFNSGPFM